MVSGFAGLGYQIVWTQQCALWLGHESAAVLAVVTAFFGGLAVGALTLGQRIENSTRPARWYAGCELLIAAWSLVLALAMSPVSGWLINMTGARPTPAWQWTVALVGTFILLLPATAAMGATLPAMERAVAQIRNNDRSIALLYASNTLGAVLGVLTIAFWLAPAIGMVRTAIGCVALNALCGVTSLSLFSRSAMTAPNPVTRVGTAAQVVLARLLFTGLLGIGYEVLVVRVLSQVTEDTVYTFAMLLAVYLVGSAVGAALYQRWAEKLHDSTAADDRLLGALAAACMVGTTSLWFAERIKSAALSAFGSSMTAAIAAEAMLSLAAFGPPTIIMGALFSHLSIRASVSGISFGSALGANTLGATAAPLVFGVLAFPLLGPKFSLLLIGIGYLALTHWRSWASPGIGLTATAVLALAVWAPPLAFIDVPEGGHVVSYQEGVMAAVSVVEDADGVARLRIDNRQQEGSSSTARVDGRQALLPLLLHPAPTHALFLGVGTGITASSAALADPLLQVDAAELIPEVISASAYFTQSAMTGEAASRLHLIAADARRYVRTTAQHYDVIISDNFHPARSGSGSLYTVEHFKAVRERLTSDGIFCQWLPLHQLDLDTLRSIVQSFLSVYPNGWAMLANNSLETPVVGLVARADEGRFDVDALRNRLARLAPRQKLLRFGIEDEFALLGSFVAGPTALHHFAGDAELNTDDHPIVAYRAPRITYAPDSLPRDRLITLLQTLSIDPAELIVTNPDEQLSRRLAAYWLARNQFIEYGRDIRPVADVRNMLAQVREPLLAVLHISPDFRPAYDPLIRMAHALAKTDRPGAQMLLNELLKVQPSRPEAAVALHALDDAAP